MLIGIGILVLGFIIMSLDDQDYGFGFLGLTLGYYCNDRVYCSILRHNVQIPGQQ